MVHSDLSQGASRRWQWSRVIQNSLVDGPVRDVEHGLLGQVEQVGGGDLATPRVEVDLEQRAGGVEAVGAHHATMAPWLSSTRLPRGKIETMRMRAMIRRGSKSLLRMAMILLSAV